MLSITGILLYTGAGSGADFFIISGKAPKGSSITLFNRDTILAVSLTGETGHYKFLWNSVPNRLSVTCNKAGYLTSGRIGIRVQNERIISPDFDLIPIKIQRKSVSAWISTPVFREGAESFIKHSEVFDNISPMAYRIIDDGRMHWNMGTDSRTVREAARKAGISVYPSLGADYRSEIVRTMIQNPDIRDEQIHRITQQMLWFGFEGVDLDFEGIDPADRELFTEFIQHLADTLHRYGLVLSITLQPKMVPEGGQDYQAIGEAADIVRIMCYDNHWGRNIPPHHSEYEWVRRIMNFAISDAGGIPPEKLVMALPLYGHRNRVDGESALFWTEVVDILRDAGLPESHVRRNEYDLPYFNIQGEPVYFEDGLSVVKKLEIADELMLKGVCFWRLGQEDPNLYRFIDVWLKGE